MTRYANGTSVSVDRSKTEIEKILMSYGATAFMRASSSSHDFEIVQFEAQGRTVRLKVPMPPVDDPEFLLTPTGKERTENQAEEHYEKEVRRRWRCFVLLIKAQLEAVSLGMMDLEEAFYANIVLPGGVRMIDHTREKLALAYSSGQIPKLLE